MPHRIGTQHLALAIACFIGIHRIVQCHGIVLKSDNIMPSDVHVHVDVFTIRARVFTSKRIGMYNGMAVRMASYMLQYVALY